MISVVIPALNEEVNIRRSIGCIRDEGVEAEIIVSDGGSRDETARIVKEYRDVLLITGDRGRGGQMNRGAACAGGDVILFLHADTRLEKGWAGEMLAALSDESVVGGAFTLCIDNPSRPYRLIEAWVKLRCSLFNLPFGDQGIFVRSDVFRKMGGYKDIPLMEDVEFIGRLKKRGRLAFPKKKAVTNDRRWEKKGLLRASISNHMLMIMYKLGVGPETLARFYYR